MSALVELLRQFTDGLKALPKARRDRKRKETLRQLLSRKHKWVTIATLADAIGASEQETKDLLVAIGARGSVGQRKGMWGLKSRVDQQGAGHQDMPEE